MKELILWKEVPRSEVPDDPDNFKIFQLNGEMVWLKRVVIPILSDQEMIDMAENYSKTSSIPATRGLKDEDAEWVRKVIFCSYLSALRPMQKRLIGGEGL